MSNEADLQDPEKLSIRKLFTPLPISAIVGTVTFVVALLAGAFAFGWWIGHDFMALDEKKARMSDTRYVLGIFHKEVGTLLGYLFIENIVRDTPSHAVLDFRILNIYWGKGYAKEAVLEGLKFKAQLKLDELQLAKASKSKMKL